MKQKAKKPRNMAAKELFSNPLFKAKTIPPKTGKGSKYKREGQRATVGPYSFLWYVLV